MPDQIQSMTLAESLSVAASRMVGYQISALPVIDGEQLGVLTCSDPVGDCLARV